MKKIIAVSCMVGCVSALAAKGLYERCGMAGEELRERMAESDR